jgi:replicative DNA helicase
MESEMIHDDRLPPHNMEAERAVLGSILIDPDCLDDVRALIEPSDFFRDEHQWVYEAMLAVAPGVDEVTVAQELAGKDGRLEGIGGAAYLSHLVAIVPTSVHAEHYANIVSRLAFIRKLIDSAGRIAAMGYEAPADTMELYVKALEELNRLEPLDKQEIIDPQGHAEAMLSMISRRRDKELDSVPFGYRDLDDSIGGMCGGDFVIIGARPSVGKSQVLLEVALHNAKQGRPVLYSSAEMSLAQIAEREIVMKAGVDIRKLRSGELTEPEWGKAQEVVAEVGGIPLYLLEGRLSVASIAQKAKLLKQTKGLRLVIVDYIQLLRDRSDRKVGDNLRERIGYISSGLKNIARDLDIPVLAACQLNREVEMQPNHRPMLSNLKESGDLEQDADVVLLLHRPELYDPNKDKGILEIRVAKNRQLGVEGIVKLVWIKDAHRYEDMVKG